MLNPTIWNSKRHVISAIATAKNGGNVFQTLLDELSLRELAVLKQHEDLVDRVKDITEMTEEGLLDTIKNDYNLTPENLHTGDVWIGTQEIEDNIPEWFESTHCGWYLSLRDDEFQEWARSLLLQEVRINIWMRYLEHKKKDKPEEVHTGMYL